MDEVGWPVYAEYNSFDEYPSMFDDLTVAPPAEPGRAIRISDTAGNILWERS